MNRLTKYDVARQALAEARSVDEVKDILDKAEAMRVYARHAGDTQLFADATEVQMRAKHRLGEMLAEQKATVGLNTGAKGKKVTPSGTEVVKDETPTLASLGISHKLSSESQKLAAVPKIEFENSIANQRDKIQASANRASNYAVKKSKKKKKQNIQTIATAQGCTVMTLDQLVSVGKKFGTIYADPPWLYNNQGTRASTDNHYSGLTVEQLCKLPIKELAADDAHLHLWTTNGFLFECPKIFDAWGFEFKSSFVWVKRQIGIGNYWRNAHEFLLTAVRGDAKRFNDKSLKSWLECDRGRHSAKPEQVRHFIERASDGPRLELFGRSSSPGWVVWGDQIEKTIFDSAVAEVA